MALIRVPSISRSVPTPVAYQVERIESVAFEFDDAGLDAATTTAVMAQYRIAQKADLDSLDDEVRACYGMPPRKYGYKAPGPVVAQEAPQMPAQAIKATDAALPAELRHELRKAAMRLGELTKEPVNVPPPSTEAAAHDLLRQLKSSIFDLEAQAAKDNSEGARTPGVERICKHPDHPGRTPAFLSIAEFNFSKEQYGQALCRQHQAEVKAAGRRA